MPSPPRETTSMRPRSLLGPLFYEELNRLSRRNTAFVLRVGMAGFLLAAVAAYHPGGGVTVSIRDQAEFARSLFVTVVGVQLAAVWFLTPLFAAAVLTEEREKKTLDLLLTTTLSGREIVVGKLFARLTFVGGVILAGLPVMAMLQVYGGVPVTSLALAYVALFANLWSVGGVAAVLAAYARTYRAALYSTWLILGFGACCPVFGPTFALTGLGGSGAPPHWGVVVTFFLVHAFVGLLGLVLATKAVRPWEATPTERVAVRGKATGKRPVARPVVTRRVQASPITAAPIIDKPPGVSADIDWRHPPGPLDGPTAGQVLAGCFVAAAALGLLAGMATFEPWQPRRVWPAYMVLAWVPAGIFTAVQAAGTVSREREADTLTMLLTVPPSRTEILWRKLLAAATKHLWAAGFTALFAFMVFVTAGEWDWYPAFLAQGVGLLAAAASAGILLTVLCRTTFLSQAAAVLAVLFLAALPWWADAVFPDDPVVGFIPFHFAGLVFVAVAGWQFAVATFWGYAKR